MIKWGNNSFLSLVVGQSVMYLWQFCFQQNQRQLREGVKAGVYQDIWIFAIVPVSMLLRRLCLQQARRSALGSQPIRAMCEDWKNCILSWTWKFAWLKNVFKPVFVFFCEDYIYSKKAGVGFAANKSNMCVTYQFDLKIYLYPCVCIVSQRSCLQQGGGL